MAVEWENGIPILTGESLLSDVPEYTQALAAASIMPVGAIMPYMGTAAPNYWLFCDGRSYDAAYFDVLSGVNADFHSDGAFRVPDFRGRSPIGSADSPDFPTGNWWGPVTGVALGQRWGDWRVQEHNHMLYTYTPSDGPHHIAETGSGQSMYPFVSGPLNTSEFLAAPGYGQNMSPHTGVNFIVYSGKPTLDTNGDILAECGQGAEIAPVTTRMMIEARLAEAGIGEEEVKMLKEQLAELKERDAK